MIYKISVPNAEVLDILLFNLQMIIASMRDQVLHSRRSNFRSFEIKFQDIKILPFYVHVRWNYSLILNYRRNMNLLLIKRRLTDWHPLNKGKKLDQASSGPSGFDGFPFFAVFFFFLCFFFLLLFWLRVQ
jgi:hypothetical protein